MCKLYQKQYLCSHRGPEFAVQTCDKVSQGLLEQNCSSRDLLVCEVDLDCLSCALRKDPDEERRVLYEEMFGNKVNEGYSAKGKTKKKFVHWAEDVVDNEGKGYPTMGKFKENSVYTVEDVVDNGGEGYSAKGKSKPKVVRWAEDVVDNEGKSQLKGYPQPEGELQLERKLQPNSKAQPKSARKNSTTGLRHTGSIISGLMGVTKK